jgi:hypothetical protein
MVKLNLVGDREADELLAGDAFALLVGMLLDQQVTIRLRPWQKKVYAL